MNQQLFVNPWNSCINYNHVSPCTFQFAFAHAIPGHFPFPEIENLKSFMEKRDEYLQNIVGVSYNSPIQKSK